MYNHLRGTVCAREAARIVVDVGGVGYDVHVPLSVARRVPAVGAPVTLLVHLVVKEDEHRLVGFLGEDERAAYRRLTRVGGVGPALALQILSAMTPRDFAAAVERQDAQALRRVKGIGEKLAKKIILELKGAKARIAQLDAPPPGPGDAEGAQSPPPGALAADAVAALETMGMGVREAEDRVARVLADRPDGTLEQIIVAALK